MAVLAWDVLEEDDVVEEVDVVEDDFIWGTGGDFQVNLHFQVVMSRVHSTQK